jgi:hypothetical protein
MNTHFTQAFLKKEYRTKREIVYFKEEETHFPRLLSLAEQRKKLNAIDDAIYRLEQAIFANDAKEDQLVSEQRATFRKLQSQKRELRATRYNVSSRDVREKRQVVMKCPIGECKGFLDTKMYCGMCDSHVCKDCHVKKNDAHAQAQAHTCNPDDVATVEELSRTTKPCPNCHARIFKTDGCDQMFCVQCHTPFSWRTGKIENGVIHNPHYFDALRAGNIQHHRHQPLQGGCGPMRDARTIRALLRSYYANQGVPEQEASDMTKEIFHFYQQMVHHREHTLPLFARVDDREEERVKFMIGQLDEKKFKQRLYVYRKTSLRKVEEQQIMDTYVNTGEELFRTVNEYTLSDFISQFRMLKQITRSAIVDIDKKYQHKGIIKPTDISV